MRSFPAPFSHPLGKRRVGEQADSSFGDVGRTAGVNQVATFPMGNGILFQLEFPDPVIQPGKGIALPELPVVKGAQQENFPGIGSPFPHKPVIGFLMKSEIEVTAGKGL